MKTTVLSNVAHRSELHGTLATINLHGVIGRGRLSVQGISVYFCTDNAHFSGAIANDMLGKDYSRVLEHTVLIQVVNGIELTDPSMQTQLLPDTYRLITTETFNSHFGLGEIAEPEAVEEVRVTEIIIAKRLMDKIMEGVSIGGRTVFANWCGHITAARLSGNLHITAGAPLSMGNYFDMRGGSISYCPSNRVQTFTEDGAWVRDGRQVVKTGKLIMELISKSIIFLAMEDAPAITEINDRTKPTVTRFCELKSGAVRATEVEENIMISEDPTAIYQMPVAAGTSSLAGSCMRPNSGHTCRHGAPFYSMVEGLKVVYTKNAAGELTGRALVWDDCSFFDIDTFAGEGEPFKMIDRIYGSEQTIENFKAWASLNGYYYKDEQCSNNMTLVAPDGTRSYYPYKYNKKVTRLHRYAPYMDTLIYLNRETSIFSTKSMTESYLRMQSTSADQFEYMQICPSCGGVAEGGMINGSGCDMCTVEDSFTGERISKTSALKIYRNGGIAWTLPERIVGYVQVMIRGNLLWTKPLAILRENGVVEDVAISAEVGEAVTA